MIVDPDRKRSPFSHRRRLGLERLRREDERTVEDAGPYKFPKTHSYKVSLLTFFSKKLS